jgi:hypothetical protein
MRMAARQQVRIPIEAEGTWDDIGDITQRLLDRKFTGKAVLHHRLLEARIVAAWRG